MKILHLVGPYVYTLTNESFGFIASSTMTANAKLSDADINFGAALAGEQVFKYTIPYSPRNYSAYARTSNTFNDTHAWQGLMEVVSNISVTVCEDVALASCVWREPSPSPKCSVLYAFDTYCNSAFYSRISIGDDCDRIFFDEPGVPNCYNLCSFTCRCFSSGQFCNSWKPILPFILYVRPFQLAH